METGASNGMSVPLLDITVHPDWHHLSQRMAVRRQRNWRASMAAVALAALLVLILSLLWTASPWVYLTRDLIFTAILWLIPLSFIYQTRLASGRLEVQLADAAILLAVATGLVFVSSPPVSSLLQAPFLPLLAIAAPLVTWPWLARTAHRFPVSARQLGLFGDRWIVNVTIGIGAGLALGLHMLLTGQALLPAETRPALVSGTLLWLVFARAGLGAVGEELFFRGWCYHLLVQETSSNIWNTTAKITLLNLLVYTSVTTAAPSLTTLVWLLAYAAAISVVNTLLRHRFRSLLPGIACNVVATVCLALVSGL